ncbi:MAG: nucleoside deaminase [Bacteroidetes bacterium]|nr:nucleoside deaminase [Bacteroidota bacterium]
MNDKKIYMEEAIQLASQNLKLNQGGPFGAIIVKNGQVVGKGMNKVTATNDPTAHAEVEAIRDATKNLNTFNLEGCEIYASCEPCPMCLGAIYWARIDKLYYAGTKDDAAKADFDDSMIYKELCLPKEKRLIPSSQMMREEAVKLFEEWIKTENKIPY